jgi:NAD(P)-dependent dehydrogenase (short-subunit alcohol dehydrogenase family)
MIAFRDDLLAGRRYLVTGASSGIGRAVAQMIAAVGGAVVLGGRDQARLEQTLASLRPGAHAASAFDLAQADAVADWVKTVAADGPLTGIMHCAGQESIKPANLVKQADLDALFGSSVNAAFGLARGFIARGVRSEHPGSLVYMSSSSATRGTPGMTAYSAAKAAIEGMTRSLAAELAPRGVRVNCISAAGVATEMHARLETRLPAEALAEYERRHLLGFGEPDDIAHAAVYLLSDAARWITGSTMVVDGGFSTR